MGIFRVCIFTLSNHWTGKAGGETLPPNSTAVCTNYATAKESAKTTGFTVLLKMSQRRPPSLELQILFVLSQKIVQAVKVSRLDRRPRGGKTDAPILATGIPFPK